MLTEPSRRTPRPTVKMARYASTVLGVPTAIVGKMVVTENKNAAILSADDLRQMKVVFLDGDGVSTASNEVTETPPDSAPLWLFPSLPSPHATETPSPGSQPERPKSGGSSPDGDVPSEKTPTKSTEVAPDPNLPSIGRHVVNCLARTVGNHGRRGPQEVDDGVHGLVQTQRKCQIPLHACFRAVFYTKADGARAFLRTSFYENGNAISMEACALNLSQDERSCRNMMTGGDTAQRKRADGTWYVAQ